MNDEVKKAWNLFLEHVQKNHEVQKLMKAVGNGTATYAEALEYSSLLSKLLVESASEIYPDDSQKVLEMLKNSQYCKNYFNHVDTYLYDLQSSLNKDSGLGMKPVKMIKYNQLLDQSVSSSDDYKADIEKYKSKAELSANKHVDTYQQYNAKTQAKAGYKVTVSRTYDGVGLSDKRACTWCLERAKSNVPYDEAFKNGMFQRHEGCHCVIEYNNNGEKSYQTSKGGYNSFSKEKSKRINSSIEKLNKESYNKRVKFKLKDQLFANKTDHAKQRSKKRNIDDRAIEYAKKNAIHVTEIYYDRNGKPCMNYIGFKITTVVNPETNVVITTYRTPSSMRKKIQKSKMNTKFSEKQIKYIKDVLNEKSNISIDALKLSDDQVCSIFEKASVRLMVYGFDKEYEPTYDGLMCESILDILGDL